MKEIYKSICKESNSTIEAGATVAVIREVINNAIINISVEYVSNKLKLKKTF